MRAGGAAEEAVAISGSAVAEMRRRALADAGATVLLVDAEMRVLMASSATPGCETGALVGISLLDAVDAPQDANRLEHAVQGALSGRGAGSGLQVLVRDRGPRTVQCMPLEGDLAGSRIALVVVTQEREEGEQVDELRQRASDLQKLAAAARALARSTEGAEIGATVCRAAVDVGGCDVVALLRPHANGSRLQVTASHGAELDGQSLALERSALASAAFRDGQSAYVSDMEGRSGEMTWPLTGLASVAAFWQPIRGAGGVIAVIAAGWRGRIVTPAGRLGASFELLADEAGVAIERAATLDRLTGMARTDPLTALSNRRAWQDELGRELARAERTGMQLSIGMIDLDDLKAYNDRWGHAAGDRVLLTAAARWRPRLRMTDLLARIGGDEFAVTMPGCGLSQAVSVGDHLRGALPDGLSCSVGVAEWSSGESAAEVLARADEALYAAKNAGRDATFALPAPVGTRGGGSVPSE